jgi:hypothetical protein
MRRNPTYAEHLQEHAQELASIQEAAAAAQAPSGSTPRRAPCEPGGKPPTAATPAAVHVARRQGQPRSFAAYTARVAGQ